MKKIERRAYGYREQYELYKKRMASTKYFAGVGLLTPREPISFKEFCKLIGPIEKPIIKVKLKKERKKEFKIKSKGVSLDDAFRGL